MTQRGLSCSPRLTFTEGCCRCWLFSSVVFTQSASLQDLCSTSSTLTALKSCETVEYWMLWSFKRLNHIALFILRLKNMDRVGIKASVLHQVKRHQTKLLHVNRKPTSLSMWRKNWSIWHKTCFLEPNKAALCNADFQSPLEQRHK